MPEIRDLESPTKGKPEWPQRFFVEVRKTLGRETPADHLGVLEQRLETIAQGIQLPTPHYDIEYGQSEMEKKMRGWSEGYELGDRSTWGGRSMADRWDRKKSDRGEEVYQKLRNQGVSEERPSWVVARHDQSYERAQKGIRRTIKNLQQLGKVPSEKVHLLEIRPDDVSGEAPEILGCHIYGPERGRREPLFAALGGNL